MTETAVLPTLGPALLRLARRSLEELFAARRPQPPGDEAAFALAELERPGATFVTLFLDGRLRGCVGSVEAVRPLRDDVWANARSAALHDPRFPALSAVELPRLHIEVSLLSPLQQVVCKDEQEAGAALTPGLHGAVVQLGAHRGLFLPQVWASLPTPQAFLRGLKHKAGLPEEGWPVGLTLWRFTVQKWQEGPGDGLEAGAPLR
jgi:hypothetical protein